MKLTIELVPQTSHFKNLRSELSAADWNALRKQAYIHADFTCQICGGVGDKHPVECHEIWEYNDKTHIQKLVGLIALCPSCHQVKHIGLAEITGKMRDALEHLAKVNDISISEARAYTRECFVKWQIRSMHPWTLDLSWLDIFKTPKQETMNIHCCECKKTVAAVLTNGKEIYPHREDLHSQPYWKCPACNNYTGCHHKTANPTKPLGSIPTPLLRHWRNTLHEMIDPLWQSGAWKRGELYKWLSRETRKEFHVSEINTIKEAEDTFKLVQRIPKNQAEAMSVESELDRLFGE